MVTFTRAKRKKAKLRLALDSVSGGGKTFSSLLIAQGLGGKIAMVDTEHGSGSLYAGLCEYDIAEMHPPFHPKKYIDAIKSAEEAGYNVIILDSLSHAWAGEGGLLEMHDKATAASRSGNSYTAWREVTPYHNKLVEAILQSSCHIIATMRSKQEYAQTKDGDKTVIKKLGLAPVQREGMEYEFTVVFDLSQDHVATASKDRTGLFDGSHFVPTVETGEKLLEWLSEGEEAQETTESIPEPLLPSVEELRKEALKQVYSLGWALSGVRGLLIKYAPGRECTATTKGIQDYVNSMSREECQEVIKQVLLKKGEREEAPPKGIDGVIRADWGRLGWSDKEATEHLKECTGKESLDELTREDKQKYSIELSIMQTVKGGKA